MTNEDKDKRIARLEAALTRVRGNLYKINTNHGVLRSTAMDNKFQKRLAILEIQNALLPKGA